MTLGQQNKAAASAALPADNENLPNDLEEYTELKNDYKIKKKHVKAISKDQSVNPLQLQAE